MSSATEAEVGDLFINAREAVYMQQLLKETDHKQDQKPIQTENSTAEGVTNKKIQPKQTNSMDMRFHWLWYREIQEKSFFWRPGTLNRRYYWTNQHSPAHHRNMQPGIPAPVRLILKLRKQNSVEIKLRGFLGTNVSFCKGVWRIVGHRWRHHKAKPSRRYTSTIKSR